jgi:HEAT repeat protein
VLAAFIDHRAWQVRWEAIQSLGKSESPHAEQYLLKVLSTTSDRYELAFANAALGRVGTRSAIPALAELIHHPVEDVKASAIHALGKLGDSAHTPLYLDALSDRSWVAKWSAMGAIHRSGDERAIGPVVDRLRTVLSRVRRTNVGGWTEPMYALDFLKRWQAVEVASSTIEWVRLSRLDRLQPHEREWFMSTFGL